MYGKLIAEDCNKNEIDLVGVCVVFLFCLEQPSQHLLQHVLSFFTFRFEQCSNGSHMVCIKLLVLATALNTDIDLSLTFDIYSRSIWIKCVLFRKFAFYFICNILFHLGAIWIVAHHSNCLARDAHNFFVVKFTSFELRLSRDFCNILWKREKIFSYKKIRTFTSIRQWFSGIWYGCEACRLSLLNQVFETEWWVIWARFNFKVIV